MRAAAIFSDRMVLQREKPIAVWGDGKDGDTVFVLNVDCVSARTLTVDGKCQMIPPKGLISFKLR